MLLLDPSKNQKFLIAIFFVKNSTIQVHIL